VVGDRRAQIRLGLFIERLGRELFHILGVHPAQLFKVEHGGGLGDARDVEDLRELVKRKELALGQLALGRPAQKRHIVEHGLGQIARADQILVAGVAVALGHLVLRVAHDGRAVDVGRDFPAEGLVEQVVLGRGGEVFAAADNVRDAHEMIVHHVGKVVGGQAVGFEKHLVLELLVFHGDGAEGGVAETGRALARHLLADDEGFAGAHACDGLVVAQIPARADVLFNLLALLFGGFLLLVLLAEAVVAAAFADEQVGVFAEQVAPLRLDIRPDRAAHVGALVVRETAFGQRFIDDVARALDKTALVGVLDAENEGAARTAGDQPGVERGAQIADVHVACRAGGKTGAHGPVRDARLHFFKKIHLFSFLSGNLHSIIYFPGPAVND